MAVTWSDGESGSESEEEAANLVTELSGSGNSDNNSSDEEVTFEELADTYKKLCIRSGEVWQEKEKQKNVMEKLKEKNMKVEGKKGENALTIIHLNHLFLFLFLLTYFPTSDTQ